MFKMFLMTAIIKRLGEFYEAINNKVPHLTRYFYTDDACKIPPGYSVLCHGNYEFRPFSLVIKICKYKV